MNEEKSFEEQMGRLEEIIGRLERGDATLDESLKLFEEGTRLTKNCQKMLDTAEKRVKILTSAGGGEPAEQDFLTENA